MSVENKIESYGLFVKRASYLTGERYAYSLLRYLRYLKRMKVHYKEVTGSGVIEEYIKHLLGLEQLVINQQPYFVLNSYEISARSQKNKKPYSRCRVSRGN